MKSPQKAVEEIFAKAEIEVNGQKPGDIQVHESDFFPRILRGGSLALGESYMAGWWDCQAVDQFIYRVLSNNLEQHAAKNKLKMIGPFLRSAFSNPQNPTRAWEVGRVHYDIGNELFARMLGQSMAYSCAYWENADNLDQAQENKLELICRKLKLQSGMKLLEVGCGWGGLAKHAAQNYGVNVLGVTISKEQAKWNEEMCKGLPVEILLQDYRDLTKNRNLIERFDRVVSVGMFEHVGHKNYKEFMKINSRLLKQGGLFLLHTIDKDERGECDPWIEKYIFPNGEIPTPAQLMEAAEGLFIPQDFHRMGQNYDKTLMAWHENFSNSWKELNQINPVKYDETFKRMWNYYLLSCAAAFRAGTINVSQTVFSKGTLDKTYNAVR